jgi:murein DD-endopeptidase MepM/ murein hydrolase activator NlpD
MAPRRALALLLAALLGVLPALAPTAAAQEDGGDTIREAKDGYDEAVGEEAEVLDAYRLSLERVAELATQAAALDAQVAAAKADVVAAQAALDLALARSQAAQRRLDLITQSLRAAQARLEKQAVEAYIGGGRSHDFTLLLSIEDFETLQSSLRYSQAVLDDQHNTVVERDRLRTEADVVAHQLEEAGRRAVVARDAVQQQEAALEAARQELAGIQSEAQAEVARQGQYLAEVQARKLAYQQRIALLAAESDSIAGMLRQIQSNQVLRGDSTGFFAHPLPVMLITSGFGPRVHPVFGDVRMHNGLDLDGSTGDPIYAAGDGVVVWASARGGYGNCVIIDHGGQLSTLYGHQSRIVVQRGQAVTTGQKIGEIGSTGTSTGSHLHFEVRVFGNPTDPVPYLA